MTDPFALLGVPRRLDLKDTDIDRLLLDASQLHHPDAGGDQNLFLKIRLAGEILKSPEKRVRAAIESTGFSFDGRGEIPAEVVRYFSNVASVLQDVDSFVSERSNALSNLGKAVLDRRVPGLKADLERVISNLNDLKDVMISNFKIFDEKGWSECEAEMGEVARGLIFLTKWSGQLKEANGKIFEALLGG